jgi:hypothetical protein
MRKLLFLALFLPSLAFAQAFPSTPILDDFNRADEDPITGIWTNGATGTGACEVISNEAGGASGTDNCYVTQTYGAAQEVYATMATGASFNENNNQFIYACLQGGVGSATVDGYGVLVRRLTAANDRVRIVRITDASSVNLGTAYEDVEFADGDAIGLRIEVGGTLTLYFNDGGAGWTQVDQVTGETTYGCAGTNLGMEAMHSSMLWDDFGGGTVPNAFMMILEAK